MTRAELEHIIRAAAYITGETRLIVIGSQAILGQFPDAPEELLVSPEADIYAPARPDRSEYITGGIGPDSQFDRTYGYHGDGGVCDHRHGARRMGGAPHPHLQYQHRRRHRLVPGSA